MTPRERFLRACQGLPVDATPVWLMRQAGRYMAEYRAVRAAHSLLEICRTPALAADVTITAAERLGVDAAIIFADLLLPCEPLGLELAFHAGEGPAISPPLRTAAQVAALPENWHGALGYVSEAIALVHRHFAGAMPVIGFAGAPFTLASYLVEGGASRNYIHVKRMLYDQPEVWHALMRKLCAGLGEYLREQVAAGAAAIQLFDSWAGALGERDFRAAALPYNRQLVDVVQELNVPCIYFSTGTAGYLDAVAACGAQVISLDWRIELSTAWRVLASSGPPMPALQGNLDPLLLLASRASLETGAKAVLEQTLGRDAYIFNLGHGILPETPVDNVRALVDLVHQYPR